ncbi:hypothetical protein [Dysgonomonas reticulitermitis]
MENKDNEDRQNRILYRATASKFISFSGLLHYLWGFRVEMFGNSLFGYAVLEKIQG